MNILIYLVLTLATFLVFWQVHNFDFVNYDDNLYVYQNPHVLNGLSLNNIIWAFKSGHAYNWHPVTWLSLMLDCQLFACAPGRIHLVNVLIHIANTLLLFALFKKMTSSLWPSAFIAAVFAIHPMHVESVAWISERKDVLSTLFCLLTLLAYIGYVKKPSVIRYALTLTIFAIGLMTKPMLVTLPLVLLLLDYWPLNRFAPQTVKTFQGHARKSAQAPDKNLFPIQIITEKFPFLVLAVISSVITFIVQRSGGAMLGTSEVPLTPRIANAAVSYGIYILKMLWPNNLAVFYPYVEPGLLKLQVALAVLVLLSVTLLIISARRHKYLFVGWFWFIVTLIPVIGLVQVGKQSYADRYTYLPHIGLSIIIAWGLPQLLSKFQYRNIVLGIFMAIALAALGIGTYRQVSYWNNSDTLFSHTIAVTKNNYIGYFGLAEDLRRREKLAPAIENFKKAIQIKPDFENAFFRLGLTYAEMNNTAEAIECFQKALQFKPDPDLTAYIHNNLGLALQNQGKYAEAFVHFVEAVQLMPDFPEAHFNLAEALVVQARLDEALDQFRAAHQLKPDWPDPMNNLAWITATHPEIKNRDVNEAVRLARRACELTDYQNPSPLGTLAAAYASAGDFASAIDTAGKVIAIADATNQPQIKNAVQYHLSFYLQGKPYIEPPPKSPHDSN